jgi:membrane protein implicated in regulation of membrane protease activity
LRKLPIGWQSLIWGILGFLIVLSGIASGNLVTIIVGATLAFAGTSAYLTSHVRSERRVKKALEVVFAIAAMAVVIYGYVITGSVLLEVLTLLIVGVIFLAFVTSWLLPRILSKTKSSNRLQKPRGDNLRYENK